MERKIVEVKITETLVKEFRVCVMTGSDDVARDAAYDFVKRKYESGKIVLSADDFCDVDIDTDNVYDYEVDYLVDAEGGEL